GSARCALTSVRSWTLLAAARSRHASLPQTSGAFSKRVIMAMRERRHLLLLISILVLFMLSPFVVTFRHGVLFLNVFGVAILVTGSYALSERKQRSEEHTS